MDDAFQNVEPLMEMDAYFNSHSAEYAALHLSQMDGGMEGKRQAVLALPKNCRELLDLGIGTGLELAYLWEYFPQIRVTGIDIADQMLAELRKQYPDHPITLYHMDYFAYAYPAEQYDAVLSIASLHHFSAEQKGILYRKLYDTLKKGGAFVLCDCFSLTQEAQEELEAMMQARLSVTDETFRVVHFDRPMYIENEIQILRKAGFRIVEKRWQEGRTILLYAEK